MRFKLASDFLQAIEVVDHKAKFLVASEAGLGVRTRFEDYRLINRGGSGCGRSTCRRMAPSSSPGPQRQRHRRGDAADGEGQSIRCPVRDIRETNRGAKGVRLVTLEPGTSS